jgi:hypothetical protein
MNASDLIKALQKNLARRGPSTYVPSRPRRGFEPLPAIAAIVAAPAIAPKAEDATATGETADGEKEAEGGVALLEIDED